ncbi:MAG: hypothetical protein AB7S38_13965 [Vulcanimicrobiota bacterium]
MERPYSELARWLVVVVVALGAGLWFGRPADPELARRIHLEGYLRHRAEAAIHELTGERAQVEISVELGQVKGKRENYQAGPDSRILVGRQSKREHLESQYDNEVISEKWEPTGDRLVVQYEGTNIVRIRCLVITRAADDNRLREAVAAAIGIEPARGDQLQLLTPN